MTAAAKSIYYYAFYLFAFGAGMALIPNVLLPIFGFETTAEVWIRVLGVFTFVAGIYYYFSSKSEQTAFFKATIYGRLTFFVGMIALVATGNAGFMLAVIGLGDVAGAAWTYLSLKK